MLAKLLAKLLAWLWEAVRYLGESETRIDQNR